MLKPALGVLVRLFLSLIAVFVTGCECHPQKPAPPAPPRESARAQIAVATILLRDASDDTRRAIAQAMSALGSAVSTVPIEPSLCATVTAWPLQGAEHPRLEFAQLRPSGDCASAWETWQLNLTLPTSHIPDTLPPEDALLRRQSVTRVQRWSEMGWLQYLEVTRFGHGTSRRTPSETKILESLPQGLVADGDPVTATVKRWKFPSWHVEQVVLRPEVRESTCAEGGAWASLVFTQQRRNVHLPKKVLDTLQQLAQSLGERLELSLQEPDIAATCKPSPTEP